jgi:hypothetical protein
MFRVFLLLLLYCFCSARCLHASWDNSFAWTASDVYKTDSLGNPVVNACWNIPDIIYDVKNPLTGNPDTVDVSYYKAMVELVVQKNWNNRADISITFQEDRLGAWCDVHIVQEERRRPAHTKGLGRQLKDVPRGIVLNFSLVDWLYGNARMIKDQYGRYDEVWHLARIMEIALHEFGHVLGLKDLDRASQPYRFNFLDPGSIMDEDNPYMSHEGVFPQIRIGWEDISALQRLYGDSKRVTWNKFYDSLEPNTSEKFDFGITDLPANFEICKSKKTTGFFHSTVKAAEISSPWTRFAEVLAVHRRKSRFTVS